MLRTLEELLAETESELKRIGIPISNNITGIDINTRAKTRLGRCIKSKTPMGTSRFRIEISKVILQAEERHIKEIIAHELIHTCRGCMNHGERWKGYCSLANQAYGYKIGRTTDVEKIGIEITSKRRETYKYKLVCKGCGQQILRKRLCPVVKRPSAFRCAKCGGKIERM